MDKQKLILPISIVLGCLILGGFLYSIQINKQQSIEGQQQIELQAKAETDKVKIELNKKEYVAKRRNDCYAVYLQERKIRTDVDNYQYRELLDECVVFYNKLTPPKSKEECDKDLRDYSISGKIYSIEEVDRHLYNHVNCLNNWSEKNEF